MSVAMTLEPRSYGWPIVPRRMLSLCAVVMVIAILWFAMDRVPLAPVRFVGVEGTFHRVKPDDVLAQVRPLTGSGFMQLDLQEVRTAVETLPWVAYARIERQWPARVQVRIWERQAYARWGETALVDTAGRRFAPPLAEFPEGLPVLEGPAGREQEVMDAYSKFSEALEGTPFAVSVLRMDTRGEWTAVTHSGVELRLGRDLPVLKADTIKAEVSATLLNRLQEVLYIDLRYTNGFSVGWKPITATPAVGVNHG